MAVLIETEADKQIKECLENKQCFSVIAGAGSGKTTSLITALKYIKTFDGSRLIRNDKKVLCITYTNRAVDVIKSRLDWGELYLVSTLHSFLWSEIKRFTPDIRAVLQEYIIPKQIEKHREKDNGGQSQTARKARDKIAKLEADLLVLDTTNHFTYEESNHSDYSSGQLNHDDIVEIAAYLISNNAIFKRIIGQKYPYIFVDEAQDTFQEVLEALNNLSEEDGLPIVGYFGDPMQQIYEKRAGNFESIDNFTVVPKTENFRCSKQVINLLNRFREDIQQEAAGDNENLEGSVKIRLIKSEPPEGERNTYSDTQIITALEKFDTAVHSWGLNNDPNTKQLFLVRQMIARRLGFPNLQKLFTGKYASSRTQDNYEKGDHFLIKPFSNTLCPIIEAHESGNFKSVLKILQKTSPAFNPDGMHKNKSIREIRELANRLIQELTEIWNEKTLGDVLKFSQDNDICKISDGLKEHLNREPRNEEFDAAEHELHKGEWLADEFFQMPTTEVTPLINFLNDHTPLSTQHGVKGEEYPNVLVVFDDIEAQWHNYSFTKMLTPQTSGEATEGQLQRSRKLAYVCFSRAEENLRIIFFTPSPESAKQELLDKELFTEEQIEMD